MQVIILFNFLPFLQVVITTYPTLCTAFILTVIGSVNTSLFYALFDSDTIIVQNEGNEIFRENKEYILYNNFLKIFTCKTLKTKKLTSSEAPLMTNFGKTYK